MGKIHLAIKPFIQGGKDLCGICGERANPQVPFDLFIASSSEIVCKGCGEKYAPDLVSLLDYFYRGHYVEPDFEAIENEVNSIQNIAERLQTGDMEMLENDLRTLSKRAYVLQKYISDRFESD